MKGAAVFNIEPDLVALLIPIIAILGGFAIAIVGIITKSKEEELKHRARIIAMEKGISMPEFPKEVKRPAYLRMRSSGLVLTFLGLALCAALTLRQGIENGIWGVLLLAIGVALLIGSALERKDVEKK
jgi:hypothetical protein